MVTWRNRVALSCTALDLHAPGVFLPALARAGYGLFLRLRKVSIWIFDGRPLMGRFPERCVSCTRWLFRPFVSCASFLSFFLFGCKLFLCFTVYRFSVAALS